MIFMFENVPVSNTTSSETFSGAIEAPMGMIFMGRQPPKISDPAPDIL
tara:strand:+ start:175 stop:318 length:144 start_codon:yes stop_codon:yes gene_type:complete